MDKPGNIQRTKLSEKLPTHAPDAMLWQSLSSKLDMHDAEASYYQKLDSLPEHSPDTATWNRILVRLNRTANIKTGIRIVLSTAAGLLLFFAISRIINTPPTYTNQGSEQQAALSHPKPDNMAGNNMADANISGSITERKLSEPNMNSTGINSNTKSSVLKLVVPVYAPEYVFADHEIQVYEELPMIEIPAQDELVTEIATIPFGMNRQAQTKYQSGVLTAQNNPASTKPPKYYTPKEPKADKNHFALAMNYLPENINNGTSNSLFHNVDITASYNKAKVRFNTSIGMAYNEQEVVFDMNYNINSPVMGVGPTGHVDTIGYNKSTIDSQYQGTEKHQYFTYNLGIGRKLFSIGKFSSWINAGAGFGIRLNNPDVVAATEKSVKNQYQAQVSTVSSQTSKPEYNNVNVNFVTGIDFNYKIFDRISLSLTPTSRWYFKSVLTKDNQPTDELTLGFMTGMKFDF